MCEQWREEGYMFNGTNAQKPQPNGEANFCVDAPDYSFANVKESSVIELWINEKAKAFRKYRENKMLSMCHRCVARHMSEIRN